MKHFFIIFSVLITLVGCTSKNAPELLGIKVDGPKWLMINSLQAKGFSTTIEQENCVLMEGKIDDEPCNVCIVYGKWNRVIWAELQYVFGWSFEKQYEAIKNNLVSTYGADAIIEEEKEGKKEEYVYLRNDGELTGMLLLTSESSKQNMGTHKMETPWGGTLEIPIDITIISSVKYQVVNINNYQKYLEK